MSTPDTQTPTSKPIPEPLYSCGIEGCREERTWPAHSLHWSETVKAWICQECWDSEIHGDHHPAVSLESELKAERGDTVPNTSGDTPLTDAEENKQTQRFGAYVVKSAFARDLETKLHAAEAALSELLGLVPDEWKQVVTEDESPEWHAIAAHIGGQSGTIQRLESELAAERQKREEAEKEWKSAAAMTDKMFAEGIQMRSERDTLGAQNAELKKEITDSLRTNTETRKAILYPANCGVPGHFRFQENGGHCTMCQKDKVSAQRIAELMALVGEMRDAMKSVFKRVPIMGSTGDYRLGQTHALEACASAVSSPLARADALLSAQPAPSPWRPMETAEIGSPGFILLQGKNGELEIGYYSVSAERWNNRYQTWIGFNPVCWMPLPPVSKEAR